jgi:hypothetical protein
MLNKDLLLFDPTDPTNTDQVGSRVLAGTDGDAIASKTIAASEWLQVASALHDGSGNAIGSTAGALNVNISSGTLAVSVDGVYDGVTNINPDNVGLIVHTRAASLADAEQTFRTSGGGVGATIAPANVHAIDAASFMYAFDGSDWARLTTGANGLVVDVGFQTVADDAADAGGSIKIGGRAVSGALTALSATNDRSDLLMDLYRRVWVNSSSSIAVASANVSVGDSEVALPTTALAGRRKMIIQNLSNTVDIYIGATGVTNSSGLLVARRSSISLEIGQAVVLYGITAAGSANVRVFEEA